MYIVPLRFAYLFFHAIFTFFCMKNNLGWISLSMYSDMYIHVYIHANKLSTMHILHGTACTVPRSCITVWCSSEYHHGLRGVGRVG